MAPAAFAETAGTGYKGPIQTLDSLEGVDKTLTPAPIPMGQFTSIVNILKFRGCKQPNGQAFSVVDSKGHETGAWTWEKLYSRADRISQLILDKTQLRRGARVALIYRKSEMLEFLAAFFGCLMAGMTAVPVNGVEEFAKIRHILEYANVELAMTTEDNYKTLSKDLMSNQNQHQQQQKDEMGIDWAVGVIWWKTDTLVSGHWKLKKKSSPSFSNTAAAAATTTLEEPWSPIELPLPDLAYIEYTKSPNGELKGVAVSHRAILAQCHAIKQSLTSNPRRVQRQRGCFSTATKESGSTQHPEATTEESIKTDVFMSWLEPRQQVGLILGGLLGTYRGSHTVFVYCGITRVPGLWEQCALRYKVTLALGDYDGVRDLIRHRLPTTPTGSPTSALSLSKLNLDGDINEQDTVTSSLSYMEAFLIDAVMVQPMVDRQFANEFLAPLGVISPQNVVTSISSLSEHGGMILSMRDHLMFPNWADRIDFGFEHGSQQKQTVSDIEDDIGPEAGSSVPLESRMSRLDRPKGNSCGSDAICHYLLDRDALKNNVIAVVATGEEAFKRACERGVVLVGAFGYAMPQATLAIVDPKTTALCQPNRVGEIWIDSPSKAFGFWNMSKHSQAIFHAVPLVVPVDTMVPELYDPVPAGFLRTGLLGGLIEGRVIVFGLYEDRIQQEASIDVDGSSHAVEYDYHYTADLVRTIMDRIVGFSSCIVFECIVNDEHLPVICAETTRVHRTDLIKLAEFVRQAMLDFHGLRPYCIAIAPLDSLPREYKGGRRGLHLVLCRKMLEQGRLALSYLWTSVDDTVFNLAVGDDVFGGIWGSEAMAVREVTLPAHTRMIQFSSCDSPPEVVDDRSKVDLAQFASLPELLVWRTLKTPDDIAFIPLDSQGKDMKPITFRKFGMKVVNIANYIEKRGGFRAGDKCVLLFPNVGVDFVATVYAVWFLGLVPVPVPVPESPPQHQTHAAMPPSSMHPGQPAAGHFARMQQEDIHMLMSLLTELRVSPHHQLLIGNTATEDLMRQKSTLAQIKACVGPRQDAVVPTVLNIAKAPKLHKCLGQESGYTCPPKASMTQTAPAVVSEHYSADMRRSLVKSSHATLMAQCRAQKVQCRLKNGWTLIACWKSFSGIGLLQSCGIGVYVGAPTVLIRYADFLASPQIYFDAVERYGAREALVNYTMLEQALAAQDPQAPPPSFNFSAVRNLLVNTEDRPRTEVNLSLERRLYLTTQDPGFFMERTRINSMFGHMANPLITTRSYMHIEPVRLYLSLKSLRRGLVKVTTEEEDPTGIWAEDSGTPVCGTTVAIVNPETREICLSHEIGEIWVTSEANVQAYTGAISPLLVEAESDLVFPTSDSTVSMLDINTNRFNATIAGGIHNSNDDNNDDSGITRYVRTGEVGFLWSYAHEHFNGGRPTSLLFVLGAIGETFEVNGLLYFPKDVEATIEKAHPNIAPSGSIVFQADEAVVCVVQVRQTDTATMNMALSVMHQILEKHQFVPDVVALVGDGVLTKSRYGEKQRGRMLSLFMSEKIPLLYIHYPRGTPPQSMADLCHLSIASPKEAQSPQRTEALHTSSIGYSPHTIPAYNASSSFPASGSATTTTKAAATSMEKTFGSIRSSRSGLKSQRSVRVVELFVGGLSFSATDTSFRKGFGTYGKVFRAKVNATRIQVISATSDEKTKASAVMVVRSLNNREFDGRQITVKDMHVIYNVNGRDIQNVTNTNPWEAEDNESEDA
ncbi:hypothetical protein BG011_007678 [Mortierella polycephala]|uniref:RRM domain-containing protein n=1 Tax=Mortierella polycephala TaxID=41804 RepID=A0A9P6QJ13_9FUNG|nr:hypothetical protein BG011_007678 [Mortierella polycephala]